MKNVVVTGASVNPTRVSNTVIKRLSSAGWNVIPYSRKDGKVNDIAFVTDYQFIDTKNIHTITMYVGASNQTPEMVDFILSAKPKRIIFNPGAENSQFEKLTSDAGIETIEACTLTMLALNHF
jgi:predicted CoA-binding protein